MTDGPPDQPTIQFQYRLSTIIGYVTLYEHHEQTEHTFVESWGIPVDLE